MGRTRMLIVAAAALLAMAAAECPNACSGHGECSKYDECTCYYGFIGNDCSERMCPFGKAHVDGAKGDLDGTGFLGKTAAAAAISELVIVDSQVYPTGIAEGLDEKPDQSAHGYMECSNKGICDRSEGVCKCFNAYEGEACQRASCPVTNGGVCSGHGVCKTVRELAADDYDNVYELWDADQGMACACDAGYTGYDCSDRRCPVGADPLYTNDADVYKARNPVWYFRFTATDMYTAPADTGIFRIKYYDNYGEEWVTDEILLGTDESDTAANIVSTLTALPNGVVSAGLACASDALDMTPAAAVRTAGTFRSIKCTFVDNVGYYRIPEIILTDDTGAAYADLPSGIVANVYDLGAAPETTDYFTLCPGVSIVLGAGSGAAGAPDEFNHASTFTLASTSVEALLNQCLGQSDFNTAGYLNQATWDTGYDTAGSAPINVAYPHLVKLISQADPALAVNALLSIDTSGSPFTYNVYTMVGTMNFAVAGPYYIATTTGTAARVFDESATAAVAFPTQYSDTVKLDADYTCITDAAVADDDVCLSRGDLVIVPEMEVASLGGPVVTSVTTNTAELRTIKRLYYDIEYVGTTTTKVYYMQLDRPVIFTTQGAPTTGVPVYKFTPPAAAGPYVYAQECSGRGTCATDTGLCKCFKGYTGEACSSQSALVM